MKAETSKTGFQGLTEKRFSGDVHRARLYVGSLGRASYFYNTKTGLAIDALKPFLEEIPELFVLDEAGRVIDIKWKSQNMRVF